MGRAAIGLDPDQHLVGLGVAGGWSATSACGNSIPAMPPGAGQGEPPTLLVFDLRVVMVFGPVTPMNNTGDHTSPSLPSLDSRHESTEKTRRPTGSVLIRQDTLAATPSG